MQNEKASHRPIALGRVVALIVLLVFLPLLLVQVGLYWTWYQTRQMDETRSNLEVAKGVAATFEAFTRDIRRVQLAVGKAIVRSGRADSQQTNDYLSEVAGEYASARSWHWSDGNGTVLASNEPNMIGHVFDFGLFFPSWGRDTEWVIGNLVKDPQIPYPVFAIARQIQDDKGGRVGTIIAEIDAGRLGQMSLNMDREGEATFGVFDRDGTRVFPPMKDNYRTSQQATLDRVLADAVSGNEATGIVFLPSDSDARIAARVPILSIEPLDRDHPTYWVAGASRRSSDAMSFVHRGLWIAAISNLLVAVISVSVAIWISQRVIGLFHRLQKSVSRIGHGDLAHRALPSRLLEVSDLAESVNLMASQLQDRQAEVAQATAELERRVAERTAVAERRSGQLRDLACELAVTEERERRRLAVDLHDGLGQILTLANIKASLLRESLGPSGAALQAIQQLIEEASKAARSLTLSLSHPALYDIGFMAGVQWLTEEMLRQYGLHVTLEEDGADKEMEEATQTILFRSLRELLINVAKHAGTDSASVWVGRTDSMIRVTVEDRGVGFTPELAKANPSARGFGLFSIRERIGFIGGRTTISSSPGRGTRITLEVPSAPGIQHPTEVST